MNYLDETLLAIQNTERLSLKYNKNFLVPKSKYTRSDLNDLIDICKLFLSESGVSSSSLINNCAGLYCHLMMLLVKENIYCDVTIGTVYIDGNNMYPKATFDYLSEELTSHNLLADINLHVWLTMRDGSILDFILKKSLDSNNSKHASGLPDIICIPVGSNHLNLQYKPLLVGIDYLYRIDAITLQ